MVCSSTQPLYQCVWPFTFDLSTQGSVTPMWLWSTAMTLCSRVMLWRDHSIQTGTRVWPSLPLLQTRPSKWLANTLLFACLSVRVVETTSSVVLQIGSCVKWRSTNTSWPFIVHQTYLGYGNGAFMAYWVGHLYHLMGGTFMGYWVRHLWLNGWGIYITILQIRKFLSKFCQYMYHGNFRMQTTIAFPHSHWKTIYSSSLMTVIPLLLVRPFPEGLLHLTAQLTCAFLMPRSGSGFGYENVAMISCLIFIGALKHRKLINAKNFTTNVFKVKKIWSTV